MKQTDPSDGGGGGGDGALGAMQIVDTFTRLIFGDNREYEAVELQVIEALRQAVPDLVTDDLPGLGQYLRALGVSAMIDLDPVVQCSPLLGGVRNSDSAPLGGGASC
ncbi:MAG: hypothetical protein ACK5HY_16010 [Parahaliea sp.]